MKTRRIATVGVMLALVPLAFAGHPVGHSPYLVFKSMDADSDGRLTREEYVAGSRRLFTDLDTNRDGQVSVLEMTSIYELKADEPGKGAAPGDPAQPTAEELAGRAIKAGDGNKDGQLSAAEHAAGDEAMFIQLDENQDGWLSASECEAGKKASKKSPSP